jgi:protein-S-isoprenylcysteine O-methyltransferase
MAAAALPNTASATPVIDRFLAMPHYGIAATLILVFWAIQAEIRFGAKARAMKAGASDRGSTTALSVASLVPMIGFILAMQGRIPVTLPGMPTVAWVGVTLGAFGCALRLWSLLVLRERFSRTLLVQQAHDLERNGPYRLVRHPGYLGSLLCLNGIASASGNTLVLAASIVITGAAYRYRIRVEEAMLASAFGEAYESYRRSTGALIPWPFSVGTRRP